MWGIFEIEYIIQFIGFYGKIPMVYPKLGSLCEQEWTWRNIITKHINVDLVEEIGCEWILGPKKKKLSKYN
jgi:hypothetical protein